MGLFVCDECGVVENTALPPWDGYWGRNTREYKKGEALCSLCHPDSKSWHEHFPRRQFDPIKDKGRMLNK